MNPVMRALGKVLRLVGISSPEDTLLKAKNADGLPSWRNAAKTESTPPRDNEGDRR